MTTTYALEEINTMERARFVDALGTIYEDSAWIAERAAAARPFADRRALEQAMQAVVQRAPHDAQLELIRCHPRLGISAALGDYSQSEQSGAGLLAATTAQREQLERLNAAYEKAFGFPFILAVRGLTVSAIIDTCRTRINNSAPAEFAESLRQIHRIAHYRLADLIDDS